MLFCNDNVDHTWNICSSIKHSHARVPHVWLVACRTNLIPWFLGSVPPWLEENQIMLVKLNEDILRSQGPRHAVVRQVNIENKQVQLALLRQDRQSRDKWKIQWMGQILHQYY